MLATGQHAWFLKIDPVWIVGMHVRLCVCLSLRLLVTSGVMWHDMNLIRLVKQVLQLLYGNYSRYGQWALPWHYLPEYTLSIKALTFENGNHL